MLLGRAGETAALDQVLATVRDGASRVLVLRGPAGIGKTALLDWAAGRAGDTQVARVVGVESEMDLGFAGLHQVVVPFLGELERLPGPQQAALGAAFGMVSGSAPDPLPGRLGGTDAHHRRRGEAAGALRRGRRPVARPRVT